MRQRRPGPRAEPPPASARRPCCGGGAEDAQRAWGRRGNITTSCCKPVSAITPSWLEAAPARRAPEAGAADLTRALAAQVRHRLLQLLNSGRPVQLGEQVGGLGVGRGGGGGSNGWVGFLLWSSSPRAARRGVHAPPFLAHPPGPCTPPLPWHPPTSSLSTPTFPLYRSGIRHLLAWVGGCVGGWVRVRSRGRSVPARRQQPCCQLRRHPALPCPARPVVISPVPGTAQAQGVVHNGGHHAWQGGRVVLVGRGGRVEVG